MKASLISVYVNPLLDNLLPPIKKNKKNKKTKRIKDYWCKTWLGTTRFRFSVRAMQATSLSRSPARTCIRQLRKDGSHAPLSRGKTPKPSRVSKFGLLARGANRENAAAQETKEPKTTVQVDLGARSYPIYIGPGLLANGDMLCKHIPGTTALVVTNETIAPYYLARTVKSLSSTGEIRVEVVVLPDGEEYKTVEVLMKIYDKALESKLDRQTTFVALGGGVIGDMTGFAASSYQRGVHFLQIPTTVMSMVDSSVGGKTGVNHPSGKNMIGAFYQPRCVLIDTDTLASLPDREFLSGLAEVVKYGLIRDRAFFEWQEKNIESIIARDESAIIYAIEKSCLNKAQVVSLDEREGGMRATLNLGHTFGHAIETGLGYGKWLHGEAVSVGIVMAAHLSHRMGWIDSNIYERVATLLDRCSLPTSVPSEMTTETFLQLMAVDKKTKDGQLNLVLLKGDIGSCRFTSSFDRDALEDTLDHFCPKLRQSKTMD